MAGKGMRTTVINVSVLSKTKHLDLHTTGFLDYHHSRWSVQTFSVWLIVSMVMDQMSMVAVIVTVVPHLLTIVSLYFAESGVLLAGNATMKAVICVNVPTWQKPLLKPHNHWSAPQ